jgi:hypothetical protein
MTIHEIRLLPPLAIGRLGSADEPLDNFSIETIPEFPEAKTKPESETKPESPLGFRRIVPAETLVVNEETGEIQDAFTPTEIQFKTSDGNRIRPVAPFLEVWARVGNATEFKPLTIEDLRNEGLTSEDVRWSVHADNRKVERRTGDPHDIVHAEIGPFSDHGKKALRGHCKNFRRAEDAIDFGSVRYIKPTEKKKKPGSNEKADPGIIRLRFTPAKGLIYGPGPDPENPEQQELGLSQQQDEISQVLVKQMGKAENQAPKVDFTYVVEGERAIYNSSKRWWKFSIPPGVRNSDPKSYVFYNETLPPALFASFPAPCWLNDNLSVSRGLLDDTCDGVVEVTLTLKNGKTLTAASRIVTAPPAPVPDSLFIRLLADDLDQAIFGPEVANDEPVEVMRALAEDILRRAYETVRFANVAVMNGNPVDGRDPLDLDTMPAEEAFGTWRMMRPVFPEHTVDTLAILALHQRVYAAMRGGAAAWFPRLLRRPDEVADFTDAGRRKMPPLMAGADGGYLALTNRQIDTIQKASQQPVGAPLGGDLTFQADDPRRSLSPRNASARARAAEVHHVAQGNPISSRPITAIGNCTPGLEVDFRAVWRRVFEGIVLREWDNLVVQAEDPNNQDLEGRRLLKIEYDDASGPRSFLTMTTQVGPSPADTKARSVVLAYEGNPKGAAPLEWSNLLSHVLHERAGNTVTCTFSSEQVWADMIPWEENPRHIRRVFKVREFFEKDTGLISRELAQPGELTQGLCSPWQNDYRECSCYYWASARPDFVNVELGPGGVSQGDNWLAKERTGSYVPDDYEDDRLVMYDDLFRDWEKLIRFVIGGKDTEGGAKK